MISEPTERRGTEHLDRNSLQVKMKPSSSKFLYILTLQTLRAWVTEPNDEFMAYIRGEGNADSILEAVPYEQARSMASVSRDGRPLG